MGFFSLQRAEVGLAPPHTGGNFLFEKRKSPKKRVNAGEYCGPSLRLARGESRRVLCQATIWPCGIEVPRSQSSRSRRSRIAMIFRPQAGVRAPSPLPALPAASGRRPAPRSTPTQTVALTAPDPSLPRPSKATARKILPPPRQLSLVTFFFARKESYRGSGARKPQLCPLQGIAENHA